MANAKELYLEFQKIRLNIDQVETPNLSKIKEIIKRVHFADILTKQQVLDNTGNAYYQLKEGGNGEYYDFANIDYTIQAKKTGLVYCIIYEATEKNGSKSIKCNRKIPFTNYARFLADVTAKKIVFSKELDCFILVGKNTYQVINDVSFNILYPVDRNKQISDFLTVVEEIYRTHIKVDTHSFTVKPYAFCGIDWTYDCQSLDYEEVTPKPSELYASYFDIGKQELSVEQAKSFLNTVSDQQNSFNNLSLIHAYVMYRKMGLIHPEYYFILKDFGRTGKGLFMKTFDSIFQVNKVNFDNLKSSGIEASNEWFNLYGCDVAYANETGEIDKKDMRILRKIATCETVSGRTIGNNSIKFKIESVLILDTNEVVDIGSIKANTSRTVKAAFKDRPKDESDTQRHEFFQQYWDFIQPNGKDSLGASISFLIHSLNYLKAKGGKFLFDDVTLKNYYTADDLTETQRILALTIYEEGFILAKDEALKKAVEEDYGSFRHNKAKQDINKIGVLLNKPKWLDGQVFKVHVAGDKKLVEQVSILINNEVDKGYEEKI